MEYSPVRYRSFLLLLNWDELEFGTANYEFGGALERDKTKFAELVFGTLRYQ